MNEEEKFPKHKEMSNAAGNVFLKIVVFLLNLLAQYINKKITKSLTPKASRPQDSIKLNRKKKKISQEN